MQLVVVVVVAVDDDEYDRTRKTVTMEHWNVPTTTTVAVGPPIQRVVSVVQWSIPQVPAAVSPNGVVLATALRLLFQWQSM